MTAVLLAPAGLAALFTLALPLLIHLARRTEQRPTDFAALRWLRPRPRPRRRPRLDERLLLVLRGLLLATLALVLAHPVLQGASRAQHWLAVVPGVDLAAARTPSARGARAVWLAPGFPDLGRPPPAAASPAASLLRQLDADLPPRATLTVLVPPVLQGADAERPRLSRAVDWRLSPGAAPARRPSPETTPALVVRYDPPHEGDVRYLRAAATAWSPPSAPAAFEAAPVTERLPEGARWIAWAAAGPLPDRVRSLAARGAVLLLSADAEAGGLGPGVPLWRDAAGRPLAEGGPLGRGRWRRFTRPLTSEATPELLQADFPARLREMLAGPPPAPGLVEARSYTPLTGARAGIPAAEDLRPAVALLAVALFALERGLATRRRRAPAP